jgi:hypothetical protein
MKIYSANIPLNYGSCMNLKIMHGGGAGGVGLSVLGSRNRFPFTGSSEESLCSFQRAGPTSR